MIAILILTAISQNAAITTNKHWREVCGIKNSPVYDVFSSPSPNKTQAAFSGAFAFVALLCLFIATKLIRRSRAKAREARLRLEGDEVSSVVHNYGSIAHGRTEWYGGDPTTQIAPGDRPFMVSSASWLGM